MPEIGATLSAVIVYPGTAVLLAMSVRVRVVTPPDTNIPPPASHAQLLTIVQPRKVLVPPPMATAPPFLAMFSTKVQLVKVAVVVGFNRAPMDTAPPPAI